VTADVPERNQSVKSGQNVLTGRFNDAVAYSLDLHALQTRKGKSVPYVAHLFSVCALVLEDGGDEDEAIAALLHDALEDQPEKTGPPEIEARFGARVLHLIESCTDTPPGYKGGEKPAWRARKQAYLDHLRQNDRAAVRLALADKLHNARDILADYRREGDAIWQRFNASRADQLWFLRSLLAAFEDGGASGPMLDEFRRVVSDLENLAGTP
jgi:(p)ppGpp synthase/HD superfamily hydrolase